MGATNKFFLDMRESEEHPPFDHHKRFCEKVKENWLTTDDFRNLKNADLVSLTRALIDKKMDSEYMDEIMNMIDRTEPKCIKSSDYLLMVYKTPVENMKRIAKKYDNISYFINKTWLFDLNTEIMKKNRNKNDNI